jgi:hypothetical protein
MISIRVCVSMFLISICVPERAYGRFSALVPFSCAAVSRPSASFSGTALLLNRSAPLEVFLKQGGNLANELRGRARPPKFQTTQG